MTNKRQDQADADRLSKLWHRAQRAGLDKSKNPEDRALWRALGNKLAKVFARVHGGNGGA